jgi:hypothetical protein
MLNQRKRQTTFTPAFEEAVWYRLKVPWQQEKPAEK